METYITKLRPMIKKRNMRRRLSKFVEQRIVNPLGLRDWHTKLFMAFMLIAAGYMFAALITSSVNAPIAAAF